MHYFILLYLLLVFEIQEFKLNPGAKTFSPSLAKRLTSAHDGMTPVVANMGYLPSNTPMLPVPEVVQPEIGVSPLLSHASSPSKFVPYTNLATGNTGGGSHFPQHVSIKPLISHLLFPLSLNITFLEEPLFIY